MEVHDFLTFPAEGICFFFSIDGLSIFFNGGEVNSSIIF